MGDLVPFPGPRRPDLEGDTTAETCRWCGLAPATTVVMTWPTCPTCANSRHERVKAYARRLFRPARDQGRDP